MDDNTYAWIHTCDILYYNNWLRRHVRKKTSLTDGLCF